MMVNDDLPAIQLFEHARAKRLKLTVSAKGIRLTIPPHASQQQVQHFIQQQSEWLKQAWQKSQQREQQQTVQRPDQLMLCYQDQPIQVYYQSMSGLLQYDRLQHRLMVHVDHAELALTQFVIAEAKNTLITQVLDYAQHYGLTVGAVRIASPTTRWGSCSSQQQIMLHAGLLLMPRAYADYVLLHELAHTRHMHHQPAFWQCLEGLLPNAKATQKQVKKFKLPAWWRPKL